ncbi:hypothetical protein LWI28_016164 [Acer negundo]|uniref:Phosphoglycerate kinase n=1 Tax=Acer negundo TaxID=4023 RepID=A0AAD5I6E4_ACENE|nr:hypothetical protein LWI28_016164 [Acer negundo]
MLSNKLSFFAPSKLLQQNNSCSYIRNNDASRNRLQSFSQGGCEVADSVRSSLESEAYVGDEVVSETLPHIQTLRKFPKQELFAKVVMVRFDSTILLGEELDQSSQLVSEALFTIKYLHEAGAKLILASDWSSKINSTLVDAESVADILSSALQLKVVTVLCISSKISLDMEVFKKGDILLLENLSGFKEEVANCPKFAELLSSGVDIFVNDSFSQSHKILASTVGVARFCYACLAGFHFEESLCQLKKAAKLDKKPYVAIIGGGNLYNKAAALHYLASRCDGLFFVGMMSFQIMHALGLSVPSSLVEKDAHKAALDLIQLAHHKNINIIYPKDFWCINSHLPNHLEMFPAHFIPDGWVPVDLGTRSLEELNSLITKSKKIIWIGPVKFSMACKAITKESSSALGFNMVKNASVVWEFLKGRKLPGIMALDRALPFEIDWDAAYSDPTQPLVVDIGSGNGLFLLGMARKKKDFNFLGLEINAKLVRRCLDSVHLSGITNGYFIETNATSTFRSIVSSYPGQLILVSVQCPNPDFNKPDHRWRMMQRSLVEAVTYLLTYDGKVFLQSDIKEVVVRMKEQFLGYSKGKLALVQDHCDTKINQGAWLEENPFGVRSDWEQHVLDRGAPMYRLLLSKLATVK